ncbi:MAG: hypothetical protein HDS41_06245, partial [Bacteroides sp.]|nr:hypothetical protein [Bacteroides sp.]
MLRRYSYNKPVVQVLIHSFCFIFGAFMLSSLFLAKESIEKPFLIIEIACGCVYIGGISISTRIKNINQLLFCIFFSSLIISFATRIFFLDYYKVAYGLAVDSYTYDALVLPLNGSFSYLVNNINTDDLGYPYILYHVYKIAGDVEFGRVLMLLLNSLLLVFSSGILYRLSILLD